jgi:hypothetical protein
VHAIEAGLSASSMVSEADGGGDGGGGGGRESNPPATRHAALWF